MSTQTTSKSTSVSTVDTSNAAATSSDPGVVLVKPPPADAVIPVPPKGFSPPAGRTFRGVSPRKMERAVLPDAILELQRFTNYAEVFGRTAPPLASLTQSLGAAEDWSSMRTQSEAWDVYARTQEGLAWAEARKWLDKMRPAFQLAATSDESTRAACPSLAKLLGARTTIAHKAVATKRANKKLEAEGKMPTKGTVGKARKKAAANAALAEKLAAAATPPPTPGAPPARAPTPPTPTTNGGGPAHA